MNYILNADAQGYLVIDGKNGTYKPGDTLELNGSFKAVAIYNLVGSAELPIKVTNPKGGRTFIGDPLWSGGAWPHGLAMRGCKYIEVFGSERESFVISGSTSDKKDSNGYPVKTAYMDLMITELSDNFKVHDLIIRDGGVGLLCKTDKIGTIVLNNFEFYNLEISGTYNEAMYIGNTSQDAYYKLNNVVIHHNYIHDIGNDGIQVAASDNVKIYNNEVVNWGTKKEYSHSGGILAGGRIKGFYIIDNYVHDGWGNMLQIFCEGGAPSIVNNNLFSKNQLDGVIIRGTNNLTVEFTYNTVAYAGENLVRVTGTGTKINLNKNILAGPLGGSGTGTIYPKNYIYLENGGTAANIDNKLVPKGSDTNYPGYGYKGEIVTTTTTTSTTTSTSTSTSTTTTTSSSTTTTTTTAKPVKLLCTVIAGEYVFRLYDDGSTKVDPIMIGE